jgi:hypothetical protein
LELTAEHLRIAGAAWAAAQDGGGVVLDDPGLFLAAHALAEQGWLERRSVGDDVAWFWTPVAETALSLSAVTDDVAGREN